MTMSDETSPYLITDDDREKYGDLTKLNNPKLSDREMAAKVVWLDRQSVDFLGVIYSARDRIMHLAVKVADLEAQLAAATLDIAENDKVIDELRDTEVAEPKPVQRYVQLGSALLPTVDIGDWVRAEDYDALASRISIFIAQGVPVKEFLAEQREEGSVRESLSNLIFGKARVSGLTPFNPLNAASNVQSGAKAEDTRLERAERALTRAGFTYLEGAAEWKPPLGKRPVFIEVDAGDHTHWVSLLSKLESPYHDDSFNLIWDEAIGKAIEVIQSNCGDTPKPKAVGYVMQARQVGGDKGFSWTEDNENFPRDIWQRKPVIYMEQDDAEYLEGYLEECRDTAAEGIRYWKDQYDALVKQERTYGEDKPADTEG